MLTLGVRKYKFSRGFSASRAVLHMFCGAFWLLGGWLLGLAWLSWLAGSWLVGWLAAWRAGWLIDGLASWLVDIVKFRVFLRGLLQYCLRVCLSVCSECNIARVFGGVLELQNYP